MRRFLGFIRFTFYISLLAVIVFFCVRYFCYYKVTLVIDDTVVTKIVKKGEVLNLDEPQKEGYTFLYWMDDSTIIDDEYSVDYDVILLAAFEKDMEVESYYVSFDSAGGSEVEGQVLNKGDIVLEPTAPTKEGYIFKEWQLNGKTYDFNTPIDDNITLKATYIKRAAKKYVVTFNTNGGTKIANKNVAENDVIKMPNNPIKEGYIFKEWQLNGRKYDFSTKITKDITLDAVYDLDSREVYVVTFDTKGGTTIKEQRVRSGEKITIPSNPVKEGYKFSNWLYNNETYNFNAKVTSDMTLKAAYVKVENNILSDKKIIREYTSDTLKYWIEDKGTYAITHIWVKDAYNQFKVGVKEPFPQLATSNSIMSNVSQTKNYTNKEMIGTNASGIVSNSFYVGVGRAVPEWKNSSISPAVLVEGEVKRNSINATFPDLNVYTYGLKKDGYLGYYNLRYHNNTAARVSEYNKMINDGVKNTFAFQPVLIHNGIVNKNLKHDNNIRQAIGQIDKNNFIFITTTTTTRSKGLSPASLATIMKELKCIEAYNLDGGGSASLIYKPKGSNTIKSVLYTSRAVADIVYFVE